MERSYLRVVPLAILYKATLIMGLTFLSLSAIATEIIKLGGKSVSVKWVDGDTVWYEAKYKFLGDEKSILTRQLLCPKNPKPDLELKPDPRVCTYRIGKSKWRTEMANEIGKYLRTNSNLPPGKSLSGEQLSETVKNLLVKYAKNCPSSNYQIKNESKSYLDREYVCERHHKIVNIGDGELMPENPCPKSLSSAHTSLGLECLELKGAKYPLFETGHAHVNVSCPYGGCPDWTKSFDHNETDWADYFLRENGDFDYGRVGQYPPVIYGVYNKYRHYYCVTNKTGETGKPSCQSFADFMGGRALIQQEREGISAEKERVERENKLKEIARRAVERMAEFKKALCRESVAYLIANNVQGMETKRVSNEFVACRLSTHPMLKESVCKNVVGRERTRWSETLSYYSDPKDPLRAEALRSVGLSESSFSETMCDTTSADKPGK